MADLAKQSQYFRNRNSEEYPVRRSDKIEIGKVYRSRSGERIRIYAMENKELHGAIYHDGNWEIDTWYLDGRYLADKGREHPRDIILSPALIITVGKKYKTRDGRPAKVYDINPKSIEFPVIGAIKDANDNWAPRVWNTQGVSKIPYGPNNDLVTEWSET